MDQWLDIFFLMMWHFFITKLQNKFTHKKFTNQYQIKTSIATDSQTQASKFKKKKKKSQTHPQEREGDWSTAGGDPSPNHCRRKPKP